MRKDGASLIEPDLLTYRQAGTRLGISASTIKRLVKAGKLKAVYPAAHPRIAVVEVQRYLQAIMVPNVVHFKPARSKLGRITRQQAADLLR